MNFNKGNKLKSLSKYLPLIIGLLILIKVLSLPVSAQINEPSQTGEPILAPSITSTTNPINKNNVEKVVLEGSAEPTKTIEITASDLSNNKITTTTASDDYGHFSAILNLSSLVDGTIKVVAVSIDEKGNRSPDSQSVTVIKDTVSPIVNILSPTKETTNTPTPILLYTISEESTVMVKVDNKVVDIMNGERLDNLTDGFHSISVYATDLAGNQGVAMVVVNVDTTGPRIEIYSPEDGSLYRTDSVILKYSIFGSKRTIIKLDGVVINKKSGETLGPLNDGNHILEIIAYDELNNETKVSRSFITDIISPVIEILEPRNGSFVNDTTPKVFLKTTDNASGVSNVFIVKVDNQAPYTVNDRTEFELESLNEGIHSIVVQAFDKAGNKGSANSSFTIDITPPSAPVINSIVEKTNTPNDYIISITGNTEPYAKIAVIAKDGNNNMVSADIFSENDGKFLADINLKSLKNGQIRFFAKATDRAGNISNESAPFYFDKVQQSDGNSGGNGSNNNNSGNSGSGSNTGNNNNQGNTSQSGGSGGNSSTGSSGLSGAGSSGSTSNDSLTANLIIGKPQGLKVLDNKRFIVISWLKNEHKNLKGYNIYRRPSSSEAKPVRLNQKILTANIFVDKTAAIGISYTYYITAIDENGKESEPSLIEAALTYVKAEYVFRDIQPRAWYKESVSKLVSFNIISGFPDGTFRPNAAVTRAEFAKLVCLAMSWEMKTTSRPSFNDVLSNHWAFDYVETAKAQGILNGYANGDFYPDRAITRAEVSKAIIKVLGLALEPGDSIFADVNSSWAKPYIHTCLVNSILTGYADNTFRPDKFITRAEIARIIDKILSSN